MSQRESIVTEHQMKLLELVLGSDKIWALRADLYNPYGSGAATIHTTFGTFDRQGAWYPGEKINFTLYTPARKDLINIKISPQSSGDDRGDFNGFLYVAEGILDPEELQEQARITSSPKYVHAMAHDYDKHRLGNRLVHEVIPQFVEAGYQVIESVVWSMWGGTPPALEMDGQVLVRNCNLSCREAIADYCKAHKLSHNEKASIHFLDYKSK